MAVSAVKQSQAAQQAALGFQDVRSDVLERGQPMLVDAVRTFPGFEPLVDIHNEVLHRVAARLGVRPTKTKHTDSKGVLLLNSLEPGKSSVYFRR